MEVNGAYSVNYAGQGGSVTPISVPQQSQAPEKEMTTSDPAVSAAVASQVTAPNKTDKDNNSNAAGEKDQSEKQQVSDEQIKQAVKEINKGANGTEAIFGIHDKTNRVTIKIVDKKTKDVIREVPAEKTLDLIAKAWEMAGLLVDEKR